MSAKPQIVNTRNRMLSQNIYMTLDTKKTDRNNNILIAGGSGCGKSFKFAKPNILQMFGSYIITDPKGELCRDTAGFLHENGYNVKVLNLIEFKKSSHYNPFNYIRSDTDVIKLIGQLISNTTPKGASAGDPFWEKAEGLFLQSLFQYVWREGVEDDNGVIQHNIGAVLQLLQEAEFKEDARGQKLDSKLDKRMSALEHENKNHPAVIQYNKVMRGAADTVRSIIISANSRLAPIQSPEIIELLSEDEFDIPTIGTQKTVIYCIIPDSDKTYNFLVGLFYSQTFNQLYYTADFVYDGPLPVHVTFLLDEFANVALPDDFCSLLSTMRSRNISSIIIIQNFGQLNALFKDNKDNIEGNCDTFIFLGGNESSTHEKVSKSVGKQTIYKKSTSISRGKNGSSSSSEDTLGRDIMMPDEVRKLKRDECIVLINGFDAVKDKKIRTWEHPLYNQMVAASKSYSFDARIDRARNKGSQIVDKNGTAVKFLENSVLEHLIAMDNQDMKEYKTEKYVAEVSGAEIPAEPKKRVIQLTFDELMAIDLEQFSEDNFQEEFIDFVSAEQTEKNDKAVIEEQEQLKEEYYHENINVKEELGSKEETQIYLRLKNEGFSAPQIRLILPLASLYSEDKILAYFNADMSEDDIKDCVDLLQI
jgi:type IV secretory pathway TraG/TraD family ATPase VirD4